jgi:hypothetical protein
MFRFFFIPLLILSSNLFAQADQFDGQFAAVEQLIKKKRFKGARAQAQALE